MLVFWCFQLGWDSLSLAVVAETSHCVIVLLWQNFRFYSISLYFLLSIHTLSGSSFFFSRLASCEQLCLFVYGSVSLYVEGSHKGANHQNSDWLWSGVSPQKARGRWLSALDGLPTRPTASCVLNRVSEMLCFQSLRWHEETFPCRGTGESEFWKQQCVEWQTPVLRWQRTERATQASCHWLFTVFWCVYLSPCYRASELILFLHDKSHFLAMLTLPAAVIHT